jgi:o-succinylbenzoate synthase
MTRCEHLDLVPYRLPLRRPWASAHGRFSARCGWLVIARAGSACGYGDCAPLPAAGTETPTAAEARLRGYRTWLPGIDLEEALLEFRRPPRGTTPAADYALDCALSDLASRLAGTSLRRWLEVRAGDSVPVNGALGPVMETSPGDLTRYALGGYRVLKLKIGIAPPDQELRRLRELALVLPDGSSLRLDANGAWDLDTATQVIQALADLPIEGLEEPLHRPAWSALARLQSLAPFPLALDESLSTQAHTLDPTRLPVRRVILKPAVIGGLHRTLTLARRLQTAGVEVVVTSLIESAAGLWPTTQLAAAIAGTIPHGLATADWLAEDLGPPPMPQHGKIRLIDSTGSGFTPDRPNPDR